MTSAQPIDVLLVEDDAGDEMITREAFQQNKIANKLHVARDGAEGLDLLYRRGEHHNAPRPDLILLDLNLPKYDGRQILEILKTDPTLHHIPIVVLTTSTAQEDILRSCKLHANAYVTKPVDFDQYLKAVRQIDEFFVQVVRLPPRAWQTRSLSPHARLSMTVQLQAHQPSSGLAASVHGIGQRAGWRISLQPGQLSNYERPESSLARKWTRK
ncbi:MAG: hypothetical protein QOI01_2789 [Mycobacterium sp.]|jgi:CheY-like chemotaxis protein|nr:hypothetical protein [Mycobacterium sp.]